MHMLSKYRILALLIAIKRYKRNSVLLKKQAKYKLAKDLGISVHLLSKYLREARDLGYVEETLSSYKVIGFTKILKEIYEETGLVFGQHKILSDPGNNFKEILIKVERYYLIDNIYAPQKYVINKKKKEKDFLKLVRWTVKKGKTLSKGDYNYLKALTKKYGSWECAVKQIGKRNTFGTQVVTSQRHASNKLGISRQKAGKLLGDLGHVGFERKVNSIFIKGCNLVNFDMAKAMYPKCTVVPLLKSNVIKVCLPSTISEGPSLSFLVRQETLKTIENV